MTETNNQLSLQKAHSAATHLARMTKAVSSFHQQMTKMHKAHHDDMHAAIGTMHKILGVEQATSDGYGNATPEAVNLAGEGTHNIQDFGKVAPPVPVPVPVPVPAVPAVVVPETFTKAQVTEEVNKAVTTSMTEFMSTFFKALSGEEQVQKTEVIDGKTYLIKRVCATCDKDMEDCKCAKAAPSTDLGKGVGDRNNLPVQRVSNGMSKTEDGGPMNQPPAKPQPVSADDVQKAMGGDQDAQLKLMKGALPGQIPNTLVDALSKIH